MNVKFPDAATTHRVLSRIVHLAWWVSYQTAPSSPYVTKEATRARR